MEVLLHVITPKRAGIACGQAGFQNLENKTSLVTLELLREGRKLEQVVYGREYMLR